MDGIDDVDRTILELLLEDARRPYSDIAERVDLSGPAISDRVERLRERGLVRRFTVDMDRSMLREGQQVLLTLEVTPGAGESVQRALLRTGPVEHCFRTVDDRLVATATVPGGDAASMLADADVLDDLRTYDVKLLADSSWSPALGSAELSPDCAECGNTVDDEGTTATLDGERYYFCCSSCESNFVDRYEELRDGA